MALPSGHFFSYIVSDVSFMLLRCLVNIKKHNLSFFVLNKPQRDAMYI